MQENIFNSFIPFDILYEKVSYWAYLPIDLSSSISIKYFQILFD